MKVCAVLIHCIIYAVGRPRLIYKRKASPDSQPRERVTVPSERPDGTEPAEEIGPAHHGRLPHHTYDALTHTRRASPEK